jgi:hypothetical protein
MKDTDKTTSTSPALGAGVSIPLTQIKPSPFNHRTMFEGIGELAGNIAVHGATAGVARRKARGPVDAAAVPGPAGRLHAGRQRRLNGGSEFPKEL